MDHPSFGKIDNKNIGEQFPYISTDLKDDLLWLAKHYPTEYDKILNLLSEYGINENILADGTRKLHRARTP